MLPDMLLHIAVRLLCNSKKHLRNLGHDLYGRRAPINIEASRRTKLPARRTKLRVLKRTAGPRVAALWRTGLMPSGAHGAGVSGLQDATVRSLRALAAELMRARGRAHARNVPPA